MPRLKRPYVATLDEVRISRDRETAIIEYRNPGVATTYFPLGAQVHSMTDQEILDAFNAAIVARDRAAAAYYHVPVEVPPGSPQVQYSERGDQWVPRGDVLRCVIDDGGPGGEATIWIDDREFSLQEFGRMLTTYAGWGMRICFVPDDALDHGPDIRVREPAD